MYKLLFLGIVLILGMIVAPLISGHQGSVEIEFMNYRLEMSVVVLVLATFILYFLLYLVVSFLYWIFSAPFALGRWFRFSNPKKSLKQLEKAQKMRLSGDLSKAGDLFYQYGQKHRQTSSYLEACTCYLNVKKIDKAKVSLSEAAKICDKNEQFSFRLTQLSYLIEIGNYSGATKLAKNLFNLQPRNLTLINLSYHLYVLSHNYDEQIDLFIAMQKVKLFNPEQLRSIQIQSYAGKLAELTQTQGIEKAKSWWNEQPRAIRKDDDLLAIFKEKTENNLNQILHDPVQTDLDQDVIQNKTQN